MRTAGISVDGYWIDSNRFYFLAERFDPEIGRLLAVPSVANTLDDSTKEIIGLEALAAVLSKRSAQMIDLIDLSSAEFDMPNADTLAVSLGGWDYHVSVADQCVIVARPSIDAPALYSPNGRYACHVSGHDLWLREIGAELNRPLTCDGRAFLCYGQEPETSLATVTYRRRKYPVGLWSPDSQWFLTHQIDERSVPNTALIQHSPPEGGYPILHTFKRALPGDPVPIGTYVAIHIASGRVI